MNNLFTKSVAILGIAFCILTFKDLKVNNISNIKEYLIATNDNKTFKNVNRDEILSYFDKDNAVIYIGSTNEEHEVLLEMLSELASDYKIDNLVSFDSTKESPILSLKTETSYKVDREPTSFYNEILDKVGVFARDYDVINNNNEAIQTDYKIIIDPTVFFVKNGKIIFSYFLEDIKLTDKELDDIKNIYKEGFEKLSINI
jgi:hypothetical protein